MTILSQTKIAPFSSGGIVPENALYPSITCCIYNYISTDDGRPRQVIVYPNEQGIIVDPEDMAYVDTIAGYAGDADIAPYPGMVLDGEYIYINGINTDTSAFNSWKQNPKGIAECAIHYYVSDVTAGRRDYFRVNGVTDNSTTIIGTIRSGRSQTTSAAYTTGTIFKKGPSNESISTNVATGTYDVYITNDELKGGAGLRYSSADTYRRFSFRAGGSAIKLSTVSGYLETTGSLSECEYLNTVFQQVNNNGTYTGVQHTASTQLVLPNIKMLIGPRDWTVYGAQHLYTVGRYTTNLDKCVTYVGRSFGRPTGDSFSNCPNMTLTCSLYGLTCTNLPNLEVAKEDVGNGSSAQAVVYDNCPNLRALQITKYTDSVIPFSGKFINGTPVPQYIFVPSTMVESYKSASGWSDYADRIMASS